MNASEAAARLGVPEHAVLAIEEHPGGHVVTLTGDGPAMLVSETTARVYVPEVDDAPEPTGKPKRKTAAKKASGAA